VRFILDPVFQTDDLMMLLCNTVIPITTRRATSPSSVPPEYNSMEKSHNSSKEVARIDRNSSSSRA
jgi:hypothetical protein